MKIIAQLKAGNEFAGLAKRMSADKESAPKGGNLGWFGPRDMDPAFTNAVASLKKGEFTKTPVQTAAGWHVIQFTDRTPGVQERLDEVVAKLGVAGADFAAVARELSDGAEASAGGDLGWLAEPQMDEAAWTAVTDLEPGAWTAEAVPVIAATSSSVEGFLPPFLAIAFSTAAFRPRIAWVMR